jgi:hypothetical protein
VQLAQLTKLARQLSFEQKRPLQAAAKFVTLK